MKAVWPTVKLGEVLTSVERAEKVDAARDYRLLGVRLDGQGPFLRETVTGAQTSAPRLFRVSEGDFIYSRLFACRGAFGVIAADLNDCYVSGEFPTYRPIENKIDVRFLYYWFRLPSTISAVDANCTGSTPLTRNRFKEEFFCALEIPLPPIAEQRRIVARIEELAAQIAEARTLREQAAVDLEAMLVSLAHRTDLTDADKRASGWQIMPLHDCMTLVDDSHRVSVDRSYPNLGIYSYARGLFHKQPIEGMNTSAPALRRVRAGQFIYSRLFAFEGAYGMVTQEYDGHFVSGEYPTFNCNPDTARVEFLEAYFKAPSVWREIAVGSKGLGNRRQRVQPAQVLSHRAWIPPLAWQALIAQTRTRIDELKRLQAETAAELDALMPAILDRAFKGGGFESGR